MTNPDTCPFIFVVSGGAGTSGEQLTRTALAQFPGVDVRVEIIPHVRTLADLETAVNRAAACGATIVHTLVDVELRRQMVHLAREKNLVAIDAMGRLLSHLANVLGREPLGQPGLYRQLRQDYFDRVEAIEFTIAHDDGKHPEGWAQAEIVLVGPSRVGKTPLSMYLAVQGWKTANVPLSPGVEPPAQLFQLDPRRVVGLLIDPPQLADHRRQRQRRLGLVGKIPYSSLTTLYEEVEAARELFRRHRFAMIDVTDKPIEESADEVIGLIHQRMGKEGD